MEWFDDYVKKVATELAQRQEDLIMQALRENGYKVTHPSTLAKRMKIQVDLENKNKRVLMDEKLILVMSTEYNLNESEGGMSVSFNYKIIK